MTIRYGFGKQVASSFDQAIERVTAELQKEGFGILTEIDVAATMKKKLDKDVPPYRILGACNPKLAHQVMAAEPSAGLLLPCNVVVRQDDAGRIFVEFMDPVTILQLADNPAVTPLAATVRETLERVVRAL